LKNQVKQRKSGAKIKHDLPPNSGAKLDIGSFIDGRQKSAINERTIEDVCVGC